MRSFLEEVVLEVCQEHDTFEHIIFILPSKRGGVFLRNALAKTITRNLFAPQILSIESFVEKISGLTLASHTKQLFELYAIYLKITSGEKTDFYSFSKWASTLLQDFNEIDRHLVDATRLFSNLTDIQEISHWSPEFKRTQMMEDYLLFWNQLQPLYQAFNKSLLEQGIGHQGLIYRQSVAKLQEYISATKDKTHVFIGFNALNKCESHIIQEIISNPKNQIFWDIDKSFFDDPVHDAGFFIRQYQKKWGYFKGVQMRGISNHYRSPKNIQVVGLPKNISQAKYVGNLLAEKGSKESFKNTAVILGDEHLLNPILNSIPKNIDNINITMGYPLSGTSLSSLFEQLINLYIIKEDRGWYYKPFLDLLSHSYLQVLLTEEGINYAQKISKTIVSDNLNFIQPAELIKSFPHQEKSLALLFSIKKPSPSAFLTKCLQIIDAIQIKLNTDYFELEHLYRFHKLFNQLIELVGQYEFLDDLKSLHSLYNDLLAKETLDFQGEPLEGLQVMGMLESRNLDFENVILTSVNEGILPSGKSNNSFIPLDLKHSFGLPTYKEKDAVYTYHFYRLLQRAKNIFLLYNTEPDVLEGGEKSRLIMQLLTDKNKIGNITEKIIAPEITPIKRKLESIQKSPDLLDLIKRHATSGFSPTSLSNYIRNPLEFYKRHLLEINDLLEVEENVAANTFGTIVHDSLEELYTPYVGLKLGEVELKSLRPKITEIVKRQFSKSYSGDFTNGKNLIAYNVIIKYLENFIDFEITDIKNHEIKILSLEQKFQIPINIPELDFPVILKGKLDRVDEKDGEIRIIDYKTGKVESKNVEIIDWEEISSDYDYSKAFQLLCYALMYIQKNPVQTLESGIISFKNLPAGLLKFATKDKRTSRTKDSKITPKIMFRFQEQLKKLILEICNPEIPLNEKEV